jgi:hypothetical protein
LFWEQGCLGAFVFFDWDVEERSQPSNVIRTIAHQLGSFSTRIGTAIAATINNMPSITLSPIRLQFAKLLVEPFSTVPLSESPIVIIMDALDECGNAEDHRDLLATLAAQSIHLLSFIRIIITSRAEFDVRAAFVGRPHVSVQELDIPSNHNMQDITFLCTQMAEIRSANTSLPLLPDWPGEFALRLLARHAAGLFVWASTACRFVNGHDPQKRLNILLQGDPVVNVELALDSLYRTALKSSGM